MARKRRQKRKREFSKLILVFETVLVAYVSHAQGWSRGLSDGRLSWTTQGLSPI